ncbi:hypothetical protein THASP1DRAFT_21731 [Thamnocephalis sphaerospora]|uniref:Uncharacterized protein n=1 Tax=Thamnocephalis sphaerospora TaxID=78915 RepID=A0A4P9XY12_9FUNG|nr:hypothetical protein THASP1DRAFT_21731 [Thamnocephalis sphaerospora]|eukprot:RKP10571.1 hypothetical protein THASP1DRAFT_21731 [Thamnocephalis sphaerospora]
MRFTALLAVALLGGVAAAQREFIAWRETPGAHDRVSLGSLVYESDTQAGRFEVGAAGWQATTDPVLVTVEEKATGIQTARMLRIPPSALVTLGFSDSASLTPAAHHARPRLKRLDPEMKPGQKEEVDDRSFFAKYWHIVIPVVIMLMLGGAGGEEPAASGAQGGGGGGGGVLAASRTLRFTVDRISATMLEDDTWSERSDELALEWSDDSVEPAVERYSDDDLESENEYMREHIRVANEQLAQMEASFNLWQQEAGLVQQQHEVRYSQDDDLLSKVDCLTSQARRLTLLQVTKLQSTLVEHETEISALRSTSGKFSLRQLFAFGFDASRDSECMRLEALLAKREQEWQRERAGLLEEIASVTKQRMDPLQSEMERLQEENQRLQALLDQASRSPSLDHRTSARLTMHSITSDDETLYRV